MYTLGVHSKSSNAAVMGELGRMPIILFVIKSMLKYCQHIDDVFDKMPLLSAAFLEDKALPMNKSWRKKLEKILDVFGIRLTSDVPTNTFIDKVMEIMISKYIRYWKHLLGNSDDNNGKLSLYRQIKGNFKLEPYLKHINKNKFRRAMTSLRISSHALEIERGRYRNIPRKERFCTVCEKLGLKSIGDEKHAVLVCQKFETDRDQLIRNISKIHPGFLSLNNDERIIFMLKSVGECATYVGKFIHTILTTQRPQIVKKRSGK